MLDTYRAVFRVPGTAAFSAAAALARLPIAMYGLALVLLISLRTGHYGFAGVLSACYVAGSLVGVPVLARLADRHGQRRVLLPGAAVHAGAIAIVIVLATVRAPDWTLIAPTVIAGAAFKPIGSVVRARWAHAVTGPDLTTAFSVESTIDEVVFIAGPLVATVVATHADPVYVLGFGVLCVAVGSFALAAQRGTAPPPHPRSADPDERTTAVLRREGILLLCLFTTATGGLFGSIEVAMVAFVGQRGQAGLAGLVLAAVAFGSGAAGLAYGARHWTLPLLDRFRLQSAIFAVLPLLLLVATSTPALTVVAFVIGLAVAPTLITAFGLVERLVPAASLTEGLAWTNTGLNLGYGIGSAVVGLLADAHGARVAFVAPIGCALAIGTVSVIVHRRLAGSAALSESAVGESAVGAG